MRRLILCSVVAAGLLGAEMIDVGRGRAESPSPAPRLDLPLACTIGRDCWVQHYVDRDPSSAARDYTCGSLTYDKHNGVDIRIPDMAAERRGVDVLAAADGKVLRARDGMADVSVRLGGVKTVEGVECGNGLVVDHGGGWQTQYCHMAKGSLRVKPGDLVKAGQPLGHVGLSGETEFPHLHITVRHGDVVVDPFAPDPGAGQRCGGGQSLWRSPPPYAPRSVINAGFTTGPVDMAAVEAGGVAQPDGAAPYLVAYVRTIGLRIGDQPSLVLMGPDGRALAPSPAATLTQNEDQRLLFVGKRRPAQGWSAGVYRALYVVKAKGAVVLTRDFEVTLSS